MRKVVCSRCCKRPNVEVFNIVSGTNGTRRIEWHKMCKCKYRNNSVFLIINNVGMKITAVVNPKN